MATRWSSAAYRRLENIIGLAAATAFVLWHMRPDLILTPTITTGGDTASHYYTAWWLRHELMPDLRLTGWVPGNYAGYPLFQIYFPLPFIAMALLSLVTGLPVAFKLVSVAGLVGLPSAVFILLRLLRFASPAPTIGAVFSLAFLFHEANSMWGANAASTLAGEFTYSIATALLVVFAGTLYLGATTNRGWIGNGVLLAALALCHAYALLASAAFGAYLVLVHPDVRRTGPYLVKVGLLAFGLIAFWAIPLVAYGTYTTAYSIVWPIRGFSEIIPPVLWPMAGAVAVGAIVTAVSRLRARRAGASRPIDHRVGYLSSLVFGSVLLYLAAWKLDVVDIRFVPYAQLMVAVIAALPAAAGVRWLANRGGIERRATAVVATLALTAGSLAWVESRIDFIDDWVAWNYGGFEAAPGWEGYRNVNAAVARSWSAPRVAYEHASRHEEAGTVRAFESLPLFSGASTLEGIYMQSTTSSPYVFYIQSEISQIPSCPLLPYHCGRLDPDRAAEHLRLFNVSDVIVRNDEVREAFDRSPAYHRTADVPPYTVYRLEDATGRYVEPLRYEPLELTSSHWKEEYFAWFKRPGSGDVTLVRRPGADVDGTTDASPWPRISALPDRVPRRPLTDDVTVTEEVTPERITIHTSRPGHPLLVKVSYHPRWHVEGAREVWLASPSFMVVVPDQDTIHLVYGPTAIDRAGSLVTAGAVLWTLVAGLPIGRRRARDTMRHPSWIDTIARRRRHWAPVLVAIIVLAAVSVRLAWTDPWVPHRAALDRFHAGDYSGAEPLFRESVSAGPMSTAAYYSDYYFALCAHRTDRWDDTLDRFDEFIRVYPDGDLVPEAHFRMAEAFQHLGRVDDAVARFLRIVDEYPDSRWAGFAAERLSVVTGRP